MNPVRTLESNCNLLGNESDVGDLPCERFVNSTGYSVVQTVWEMSDEELEEVKRNKRVYIATLGITQPPMCVGIESFNRH